MNTKKKPKIIEKICISHGETKFFLDHQGYYKCKICYRQSQIKCTKSKKQKLVELFGGKCELCGYNKCIAALEFHHINPSEKDTGVAICINHRSFPKCIKEANKCILLCSNCHREIENKITELPKELTENRMPVEFSGAIHRCLRPTIICMYCNVIFTRMRVNQKYCSVECRAAGCRKITKEDLKNSLLTMTCKEIGEKYNMKTNTISKLVKKFGFNLKRQTG